MARAAKPIPEGFHTITPYITVKGAGEAIAFYEKAFGAEEILRIPGPDGQSVMHAEIKIGDSFLFIAEEFPNAGNRSPKSLGGVTASIHLYVADVDAAFKRATEAGCEEIRTCSWNLAWMRSRTKSELRRRSSSLYSPSFLRRRARVVPVNFERARSDRYSRSNEQAAMAASSCSGMNARRRITS